MSGSNISQFSLRSSLKPPPDYDQKEARADLIELIGNPYGPTPKLHKLGEILARSIGKFDSPYSTDYLIHAARGNMKVGYPLKVAIWRVARTRKSEDAILSSLIPITVFVVPGTLEDGDLIITQRERRPCRRCGRWFHPNVHNQRSCTPFCSRRREDERT